MIPQPSFPGKSKFWQMDQNDHRTHDQFQRSFFPWFCMFDIKGIQVLLETSSPFLGPIWCHFARDCHHLARSLACLPFLGTNETLVHCKAALAHYWCLHLSLGVWHHQFLAPYWTEHFQFKHNVKELLNYLTTAWFKECKITNCLKQPPPNNAIIFGCKYR